MKRVLSLFLALILCVGFLPAVAAEEPVKIRVNLASEPPELNSCLTTSTGSMSVLRHVMDGLITLDANDQPVPALAMSWDITNGGDGTQTYVFHLRQNATWQNGDPVTANDFVYAWSQHFTMETGAAYAYTWAPLILGAQEHLSGNAAPAADLQAHGYTGVFGFEAVDDYTFRVTTTGIYPYFIALMEFPSFLPMNQKAVESIGWNQYAWETNLFVGNGPYIMTEWVHEDHITVKKNLNYWNAATIQIDEIEFAMIGDNYTALIDFYAGEMDLIALYNEDATRLLSEGYNVQTYNDGSTWYFEYNIANPGLNNVKVRTALTLGVDTAGNAEHLFGYGSSATSGFVPPAIQGGAFTKASPKKLNRITDGNYSAVKALLLEGLAEEGLTLETFRPVLLTDEGYTAARNCAFFQSEWLEHLGVEAEVVQMTYRDRIHRMQNGDFDIVMAGWGPDYNDPMTFLDLFVTGNGNNHTGYSNPEYDRLVMLAKQESDEAKRTEYMYQLEEIILTDLPIGPIYNRSRTYVTSDRLSGVIRTAFQDLNLRYCSVAGQSIRILIDGVYLRPTDAAPFVLNERTMVPVRAICEALNGEVTFADGKITVTFPNGQIAQLAVGSNVLQTTDPAGVTQTVQMDVEVYTDYAAGRTYIPARYIAEAAGCTVSWNQETYTVIIRS